MGFFLNCLSLSEFLVMSRIFGSILSNIHHYPKGLGLPKGDTARVRLRPGALQITLLDKNKKESTNDLDFH